MAALLPSFGFDFRRVCRTFSLLGVALGLMLSLVSCARFEQQPHDHVYVSSRQVYLHDRVAAVSNRVALVTNGQPLEVLEHGRRFYKVRTAKGEIGWLEEHAVIDQDEYGKFQALDRDHAQDQAVATAQLRDDLYLHLTPGRKTDHFLLIAGNAHVQLLARGSVPRVVMAGAVPAARPASAPELQATTSAAASDAPPPVPMEDWWLVRDAQGNVGWLLGSRVDVDIPDAVGEYAEGQRMVAAYPLATVVDHGEREARPPKQDPKHSRQRPLSESNASSNSQPAATLAVPPVERTMTEYLTLLAPPRSGLPYDFDQIRVFTWSLNHHRYETAYRLHGFRGYLPVRLTQENDNGQIEPVFSFQIAADSGVTTDPDTGQVHPLHPRTIAFRLEGNITRRTGGDLGPIELSHSSDESAKSGEKPKRKRR